MAPILHCIRHAEGYHNLAKENEDKFHDPDLTPYGFQQCEQLCENFPYHSEIDEILVSPLRRTIQTAHTGLATALGSRKMKLLLMPRAQETSSKASDTGTHRDDLATEFGDLVETRRLEDSNGGWKSNAGQWSMDSSSVDAHAYDLRRFIQAMDARMVVLVTHGGFLHYLTEDWSDNPGHEGGTGWKNTEFRSYRFVDGKGAHLQELDQSRARRVKGKEWNGGFMVDKTAEQDREAKEKAEKMDGER